MSWRMASMSVAVISSSLRSPQRAIGVKFFAPRRLSLGQLQALEDVVHPRRVAIGAVRVSTESARHGATALGPDHLHRRVQTLADATVRHSWTQQEPDALTPTNGATTSSSRVWSLMWTAPDLTRSARRPRSLNARDAAHSFPIFTRQGTNSATEGKCLASRGGLRLRVGTQGTRS